MVCFSKFLGISLLHKNVILYHKNNYVIQLIIYYYPLLFLCIFIFSDCHWISIELGLKCRTACGRKISDVKSNLHFHDHFQDDIYSNWHYKRQCSLFTKHPCNFNMKMCNEKNVRWYNCLLYLCKTWTHTSCKYIRIYWCTFCSIDFDLPNAHQ